MSKFVLTAQVQLQAPNNSRRVLEQVRRDLGSGKPVTIPIEVAGDREAQRQIRAITQETELAASAAESLGRSFGLAIRRFAAFTVASRAVSLFTNSLANAVDDAIDFQREIVRVAQVTGRTVAELRGLQDTISNLSKTLGTSSKDLLDVAVILSQAGIAGRDLEIALSGLAKSTLAPTFNDIKDTAEGAVAILSQFGQGVQKLESQLGSINAVSGKFAVESDDLIGAVRRFGGVFKASGGSLEELLALFTSIRATTRESAESIATGLRTIFVRVQRPKTIKFLEEMGIKLTDLQGRFVGPFEAAQRLGQALEGLQEGDTRFIAIAEELGGFRQIGKVIPLLRQYKLSQDALKVAQEGSNSLAKDAETAQQALAVQITKVREEFFALVRGIAESTSFQVFVKTTLSLASAFIKVAEALKPILPIIATIAAFKFAKGLGSFISSVGSTLATPQRRSAGGRILAFAEGGTVPGSGNKDTVPAMLTPGEFVVKKSSAQAIGASTLNALNKGGHVQKFNTGTTGKGVEGAESQLSTREVLSFTLDEARGLIKEADSKNGKPLIKRLVEQAQKEGKNAISLSRGDAEFTNNGWSKIQNFRSGQVPVPKPISTGSPGVARAGIKTGKIQVAKGAGVVTSLEDFQTLSSPTRLRGEQRRKLSDIKIGDGKNKKSVFARDAQLDTSVREYGGAFLRYKGKTDPAPSDFKDFGGFVSGREVAKVAALQGKDSIGDVSNKIFPFKVIARGLNNKLSQRTQNTIKNGVKGSIRIGAARLAQATGAQGFKEIDDAFLKNINIDNIIGNVFEGILARLNVPFSDQKDRANAPFDFPRGLGAVSNAFQGGSQLAGIPTDAKSTYSAPNLGTFAAKAKNQIAQEIASTLESPKQEPKSTRAIIKRASGGLVPGTGNRDTVPMSLEPGSFVIRKSSVNKIGAENLASMSKYATGGSASGVPALVTPGEWVYSSKEAKSIGYGNLNQMNKKGVAKFKRGGGVGFTQIRAEDSVLNFNKSLSGLKKIREEIKALEDALSKPSTDVNELVNNSERLRDLKISEKLKREDVNKAYVKAQGDASIAGKSLTRKSQTSQPQQSVGGSKDVSDCKCEKLIVDELKKIADILTKSVNFSVSSPQPSTQEKPPKGGGGDDPPGGSANKSGRNFGEKLFFIGAAAGAANLALESFAKTTDKTSASQALLNDALSRGAGTLTTAFTTIAALQTSAESNFGADGLKAVGDRLSGSKNKSASLLGKGIGKLGGGLTKAAGFITKFIGPIGGAITAFQLAGAAVDSLAASYDRAAIKAVDAGDALGAVENTVASQGWRNFSQDWLTVGGLAGKLVSVFESAEATEKAAQERSKKDTKEIAERALSATRTGVTNTINSLEKGQSLGDQGEAGLGIASASIAKNVAVANQQIQNLRSLGDLSGAKDIQDQLDADFQKSITELLRRGASDEQLQQVSSAYKNASVEAREAAERFVQTSIAAREAAKVLSEARFDSLKITSAFTAANSAVAAFTSGLDAGSNTLQSYVDQLNANKDVIGADNSELINNIESELIASIKASGGAGSSDLIKSIRNQSEVARSAGSFSTNVGDVLSQEKFADDPLGGGADRIGQIQQALETAIPNEASPETRAKITALIQDRLSKIIPTDGIPIDVDSIISDISGASLQLSEGLRNAASAQASHNQKITELYRKREELESRAAESLNSSIDTQIEASKIFQQFGGSKFKPKDELGARIAQFNNVGRIGGLGADVGSGNVSDIRRVSAQIGSIFNRQQRQALTSTVAGGRTFTGTEGIQEDKRGEARKANEQLLKFTRQRIDLLQEELKIVDAKNKAEQDALNKLIGGDVEGFIADQAAAGAAAALRSGSSGLTRLFSGSALGAGFQTLKDQGLSDSELKRAASLTLSGLGITDSRSAGALAGVSPEAEAIKAEGRELSAALGGIAQQQASFDTSEISINDATITASNVIFNRELAAVSARNAGVTGLAKGGVVYASRGMFVPRGTDTVPAMLTPGEFVVNRSAVRRGNNLQILRTMNSSAGASSPTHMRSGGQVRYYNNGGAVDNSSSVFSNALPQLSNIFNSFSSAVDKLVGFQFTVKLDPTNINVNFNGTSFLESMKDDIKNELLDHVSREISTYKLNSSGDLEKRRSVN